MELKSGAKSLFSGVMISYALTLLIFIIYAILLTYTRLSENNIPLITTIICVVSALVAGFDAVKGVTKKGWLWGLCAGLLYAILLIGLISFMQGAVVLNSRIFSLIAISLAGGGLGGVIGINTKIFSKRQH